MEALLSGKIVLVTGGSRGLGASISKKFASSGAKVAINFLKNSDSANKTLQSIWILNGTAIGVPCDIRDLNAVTKMTEYVSTELGGSVDILVNNAWPGQFVHGNVQSGWDTFQHSMETILHGSFNTINAVLPRMIEKRYGRIINIGSFTIWYSKNNSHYTTAKNALLGLSRSVAHDYGRFNITSNSISPGPIWGGDLPQPVENMGWEAQLSPLGRSANFEDISKVALFLASDLSDGVTGLNLPVCGGLVMT